MNFPYQQLKKYLTKQNILIASATFMLLLAMLGFVYYDSHQRNLTSNAAGTTSIEPEDGTIAGNVTVVNSASASGAKYLKFGTAVPAGFVSRNGNALVLDGQPYKFVGFNAYGMSGCETGTAWTPAAMDSYFKSLPPKSITRVWAFAPFGFPPLDNIVAAAEANNQKLIFSLADGPSNCETDGAPSGKNSGKTLAWYTTGYKTTYMQWVGWTVGRYKNSPAIGMWEIINEPGNKGATVTDTQMKAFLDDVAATIKTIDPNHLVESGSQAEYISGTNDYAYVHSGPNIDVASLHEYDYDYNNGNTIISPHFAITRNAMNTINKPIIIGESGIQSNIPSIGCRTSFSTRANAFEQKFDGYLSQGAAGVLIWNRGGKEYTVCEHSVSASDTYTIDMVKNYIVH